MSTLRTASWLRPRNGPTFLGRQSARSVFGTRFGRSLIRACKIGARISCRFFRPSWKGGKIEVPRDAARAPPNVGRLVGALTPHPSFSGSKFEPLKRRCGTKLALDSGVSFFHEGGNDDGNPRWVLQINTYLEKRKGEPFGPVAHHVCGLAEDGTWFRHSDGTLYWVSAQCPPMFSRARDGFSRSLEIGTRFGGPRPLEGVAS
jgi:hypothetical protein